MVFFEVALCLFWSILLVTNSSELAILGLKYLKIAAGSRACQSTPFWDLPRNPTRGLSAPPGPWLHQEHTSCIA